SGTGWWLLATIALAMLLVFAFAGPRVRGGIVGLAVAGGLLGTAIGLFALAFHTYVPRWTGLVRPGQYVPLFVAGGLAFGVDGARIAWSSLVPRRTPRLAWPAAAVISLACLLPLALAHFQADAPVIRADGV